MNGSPSRNHDVSLVVSARAMARAVAVGRVRTDSTNAETSAMPALAGDRQQARLDQVLLARLEHDRALPCTSVANPVEAGRR